MLDVKRRKILAFLVLLLAVGIVIYAGLNLRKAEQIYQEGDEAYAALSGQVRKTAKPDSQAALNGQARKTAKPDPQAAMSDPAREIAEPDSQAALSDPERKTAKSDPQAALSDQDSRIAEAGSPICAPQTKAGTPEERPASTPQIDLPQLEIDFTILESINDDAAAWLYCPGTVIDYPVVSANDYSYYLDHLPDGTMNANGTLFIDYNCRSDFSDPLTVIYGHHMKSGKMFGSLKGYKDQRYYEEHPVMYLYTPSADYRIELLYGCVIGAGQWRERAFMYPENADALISYAMYNTTFKSGTEYKDGDRIVALSTCSYEFDDARYIVIGILREV